MKAVPLRASAAPGGNARWPCAAFGACCCWFLLYWAAFMAACSRPLKVPVWARLAILAGGTSLFAVFAPYWLHRWVWRQRRETQLARLIAKRYPGLGDRLLGVIELQDQQGSADSLSPRLREAAMEAVAIEAGRRQLDDALPPQRHRRWAFAARGLAAAAVAAFALTPRAGLNALQRWLMPLSKTERYTFTKLDNPPTYRAVAFGEAFEITLHLSKESEQRPSVAGGRYGLQPEPLECVTTPRFAVASSSLAASGSVSGNAENE